MSNKTDYRPISLPPIISKYLQRFFIESQELLPVKYFYQNCMDSENGILHKCSFKLIRELAKVFRYICSRRNRINGPKQSDCLPHDLLIAKLVVYDFDNKALALITDNLTNHLQRVKIGSTFRAYL